MKYKHTDIDNETKDFNNLPETVKQKLEKLQLLECVINQSTIVAVSSKEGHLLYVNDLACEVSKYKKEELVGQHHTIFYSTLFRENFLADMVHTLKDGQIWKGEILNERKDGSNYWVYATVVPIINDVGEIEEYYSISTEITKEKEFAEEAKRNHENYRLIAENTINLISSY